MNLYRWKVRDLRDLMKLGKGVIFLDTKKEVEISNTHVPDKLYGYGMQVRQMLYELLRCEVDAVVSVEKFDDVGVETLESKEAIQTKSALSDRNPVSDKAVDLWKTLHNWMIALKSGELDIDRTLFTLVINVDKSGTIISAINDAKNQIEALKAYGYIKKYFCDQNGQYVTQSKSINHYVETFLDEENSQYALSIIEKFKLVVMNEGHTVEVYKEFKAKTYLPMDIQELVFDKMLGWIDRITASQIEKGATMQISKEDFQKELILTQTLVNQNKCLAELAPQPTNKEIEIQQNKFKTYIKQLKLIDLDYDDQLIAINDYLKAANNRTLWASKGDINEEMMNQYFDDLKSRWKTKKNIVEIDKEDWEEIKRGKYLYNLCQDEDVNMGIIVTPRFFKNGCYHELADIQQIGWHPNYKQKLKEDEKHD